MAGTFTLATCDWERMDRTATRTNAEVATYTPRQWTSSLSLKASALPATKTYTTGQPNFTKISDHGDHKKQVGAQLLARAIVRWAIPRPRIRSQITNPTPASVDDPTTFTSADGTTEAVMVEPGVLRAELNRAAAGNRPLSEQSNQSAASTADTVKHVCEDVVICVKTDDESLTPTFERKLAAHRPPPIDPNAEQTIFSDFESPIDVEEGEGLASGDAQAQPPASISIKQAAAESMRSSTPDVESLQAGTPIDDAAKGASQDSRATQLLFGSSLVELIPYPSPLALTRSASAGNENMSEFLPEGILSSEAGQVQKGLDRSVVLGELRVGDGCPRAIRSRPSTPSIPLSRVSGAGKIMESSAEAQGTRAIVIASGSSKTRAKYDFLPATRAALGVPDREHCEGRGATEGGVWGAGGNMAVAVVANGAVRLEALDRGGSKRSGQEPSTEACAILRSRSVEPPRAAGRGPTFVRSNATRGMGSMQQATSQAKLMPRAMTGQGIADTTADVPPMQSRNGLEGEQCAKQMQGAAEALRERGRIDIGKLYRLGRPSSRAWR